MAGRWTRPGAPPAGLPMRGHGRSGRRLRAVAPASLLALGLALVLALKALACGPAAWGFAAAPSGAARAAQQRPEPEEAAGVVPVPFGRRAAALAVALAPAAAAAQAALAEEVPATTPAVSQATTAPAAKLQRVFINVRDEEALEQEVKFWTDACQMKVLRDAVGGDGNRSAVLAFGPEAQKDGGAFALEVKLDPGLAKRKRPRLLNYEVLQPTVNALNFMQLGAKGKIVEIFGRVQQAGGSSLIGDASYLDVESPRGVAVRLVPRDSAPSVELVSFNVEVPAFDGVTKFYKRALGFKELTYSDAEPPVQKLSAFLGSDLGGPNLLLSPVPDGRLKTRGLDEFDGVLVLTPSTSAVAKAAEDAVALAAQERAAKEEEIRQQRIAAKESGAKAPSLKQFLSGTKAEPSVQVVESTARLNDGVGNILFVTDQADFERQLA